MKPRHQAEAVKHEDSEKINVAAEINEIACYKNDGNRGSTQNQFKIQANSMQKWWKTNTQANPIYQRRQNINKTLKNNENQMISIDSWAYSLISGSFVCF